MASLADIARVTAATHDMLPDGAVVLALVSGGADSVALLHLLAGGAIADVGARLSVLHVNHLLRGEDADADQGFVEDLCARLGVVCRTVRYDVAAYAATEGLNLEDAGRRVRYRFAGDELDARCDALGVAREAGRIAVAHTLDDRIETFLARLVRGAGSGALGSIAPTRGRVVRPLVEARRADVIGYLEAGGHAWREDVTNTDTTRERAWVRHDLLPVIEARNPAFAQVATRIMSLLAEDDAALGTLAAEAALTIVSRTEAGVCFERDALAALPPAVARRVVRDALRGAFPECSRLELAHTDALVYGATAPGFARDLPFGLRAAREYGRLRISRRGEARPCVAPGLLELPGALDLGAGGVIEAREAAPGTIARGPDTVSIDAEAVAWPLAVDPVREGDRMRPLGLGGSKKLSDLLVDAKVPRRLRAAVPVVRDGRGIVWLAGVALAESCRVRASTRQVAELVWRRPGTSGHREPG